MSLLKLTATSNLLVVDQRQAAAAAHSSSQETSQASIHSTVSDSDTTKILRCGELFAKIPSCLKMPSRMIGNTSSSSADSGFTVLLVIRISPQNRCRDNRAEPVLKKTNICPFYITE